MGDKRDAAMAELSWPSSTRNPANIPATGSHPQPDVHLAVPAADLDMHTDDIGDEVFLVGHHHTIPAQPPPSTPSTFGTNPWFPPAYTHHLTPNRHTLRHGPTILPHHSRCPAKTTFENARCTPFTSRSGTRTPRPLSLHRGDQPDWLPTQFRP